MRTLVFNVSGQKISRDPNCDFSGIVAGSKGYLMARFNFSTDWIGCKKAAVFVSDEKEYPVKMVGNSCVIPPEALTTNHVKVYVVGRRSDLDISTNTTAFSQKVRH